MLRIGTGVMGLPMCGHLVKASYSVKLWARSPSSVLLEQYSGKMVQSPSELASQSDVVFTIVGGPKDVESVIVGKQGVLEGMSPDGIIVDMSTSSPELAVEIFNEAKERKVHALDIPVSGGDVGAREAKLSMMAGGDSRPLKRIFPILKHLGPRIVHVGEAGA